MSPPQEDYIEVDLSSEQDKFDVSEELSFQEKIVEYEQKIDDAIGENGHDEAQIEELEEKYITEVFETSEKNYNWWLSETSDQISCRCIDILKNKDLNQDKVAKLEARFRLYRRTKKRREGI